MLTKITIPALVLGLSLSACSAKVDAPVQGFTIPAAPAFSNKVSGPALDGKWLSSCEPYGFGKGFVVYKMTIKGQSVNRVTSEYVDQNCYHPAKETAKDGTIRDKVTTEDGIFRYNVKYDAQNFEVEYRMNFEHGTYDFPENIRFDGTTLSITDHISGPGVVPHIVLRATN